MRRMSVGTLFILVALIAWLCGCGPVLPPASGDAPLADEPTPRSVPSRLLERVVGTATPGSNGLASAQATVSKAPTLTTEATAEPVDGWVGTIVSQDVPAPYDDYFSRQDGTRLGIAAPDPQIEAQIEALRDTGRALRVWGDLDPATDDYNGMRLNAGRIEVEAASTERVSALRGTILSVANADSAAPTFRVADGKRYLLVANDEGLRTLVADMGERDMTARVWGWLVAATPEGVSTATPGAKKAQSEAGALVGTLVAERIEIEGLAATPVDGWTGLVIGNPPGAQFDDYFQMLDAKAARHGITSADPAIEQQIIDLRDTGQPVWLWGTLVRTAADAYGSAIEVTRIETRAPMPRAEAWSGRIVRIMDVGQHVDRFQSDDGATYALATADETMARSVADAAWRGMPVQVWGVVSKGDFEGIEGVVAVEQLQVVGESSAEERNLSPFALTTASSTLPPDGGGSYESTRTVDGLAATCWAEGAPGPGVGEAITLTFPSEIEVSRLTLVGGFARDEVLWAHNNRPHDVTIRFAGGYQAMLALPDTMVPQTVEITPVRTDHVTLVIDSTYVGVRFDDTCLAEIEVWGRVVETAATP